VAESFKNGAVHFLSPNTLLELKMRTKTWSGALLPRNSSWLGRIHSVHLTLIPLSRMSLSDMGYRFIGALHPETLYLAMAGIHLAYPLFDMSTGSSVNCTSCGCWLRPSCMTVCTSCCAHLQMKTIWSVCVSCWWPLVKTWTINSWRFVSRHAGRPVI